MEKHKGDDFSGYVEVRGARTHNLKNVDLLVPRDALVVFTGVSGSGKSSLAFGTLYAEAQRRYLESVSPYARRLFNQMSVPEVDQIHGLPPAVALQQGRGAANTRSTVGSVTTISNLLRMLYSRAGDYPDGLEIIYAEGFSSNTPEGACPECHGLGKVYSVTEDSMVPDASLTIRERAIAAWPTAWGGQNQRDILTSMGYDVDVPWKDLPQKKRDWILFTEEQPEVPVYPGLSLKETQKAILQKRQPDYMGTFTSARRHVMHTFANSQSAQMKKRAAQYMLSVKCPLCEGKKLRAASLLVKVAGLDIAEISSLPLAKLLEIADVLAYQSDPSRNPVQDGKAAVTFRIANELIARLQVIQDLGLGYLALDRSTPTLSPGELQRLRLATQVQSHLFGVVYVLDEPSAGLHPADTRALMNALQKLRAAGNTVFVVEHEIDVIAQADWIVDVGPAAGESGGEILYSGPAAGLKNVPTSLTAKYLYQKSPLAQGQRKPKGWLKLAVVQTNNLKDVEASFPIGVFTAVSGVSGSGKSSLVSRALVQLMREYLGSPAEVEHDDATEEVLHNSKELLVEGKIISGQELITRLVVVDQKPIGRTPRSNLATYTGLFDYIRSLFAKTPLAKSRKYDAGRFSFNVAKGRCPHCKGEGQVMVELLFLPSVYSPCPACGGSRYNAETLQVRYRDKDISEILKMSVEEAWAFFEGEDVIRDSLQVIREVGLGYLRLGQSATELSGGEAQRIKLATELQGKQRGSTLYVLDEPTTGLHPSDVERLLLQLNRLADAGHTVVVVEHDMDVLAQCDWIIDMGPGAGNEGGTIVAQGKPEDILKASGSKTAPYLKSRMASGN